MQRTSQRIKGLDGRAVVSTLLIWATPAAAAPAAQALAAWALLWGTLIALVLIALLLRVTHRRDHHDAATLARARTGLGSIEEAVITTDAHGRVRSLNAAAESMLGVSEAEARGRPFTEIVDLRHESSHATATGVLEAALRTKDAQRHTDGLALCTGPGHLRAVELTSAPVIGRGGRALGTVQILADVTTLRALSRELHYHATHDPLTGLLNRREFEKRVLAALDEAHANEHGHVVGYLDLHLFEAVNDVGGRKAGDALLRRLGQLIELRLRPQDSAARIGGDHFGLLFTHSDLQTARAQAQGLLEAIGEFEFRWEDQRFRLGAHVGLARIDARSEGLVDVLRAADLACDSARAVGPNAIQVFAADDAGMRHRRGEIDWIQRVKQALEHSRFELHAQTIQPLAARDAELLHEILLRLRDASGELVEPARFIPSVERYELGPLLDRWVLERALSALREAPAAALEGQCFNINLSGQTLGDNEFLAFVLERIETAGVPGEHLCFEITETAAIADLARARRLMEGLRAQGCRFALDDFGSGLSSLTYLKHLPVEFLKIDGAFIRNLLSDPTDRALVESINQIGHVMGMRTIAEHVVGEETRELLRALGVDYIQGEAVAPPRPLGQVLAEAEADTQPAR
jgi:diguanylate cyclase (GGDEF)-like protein/PAS domain S-box-containing protein